MRTHDERLLVILRAPLAASLPSDVNKFNCFDVLKLDHRDGKGVVRGATKASAREGAEKCISLQIII